jgi:hypothetical protein
MRLNRMTLCTMYMHSVKSLTTDRWVELSWQEKWLLSCGRQMRSVVVCYNVTILSVSHGSKFNLNYVYLSSYASSPCKPTFKDQFYLKFVSELSIFSISIETMNEVYPKQTMLVSKKSQHLYRLKCRVVLRSKSSVSS